MKMRISHLQKGFTMIEMMVIFIIIGIVIGIGTPIVMNIFKDSDAQELVSNAKTLEDASHMYFRDTGLLPTSESVSEISEKSMEIIESELAKADVVGTKDVLAALINEGYIKTINYDDLKDYTNIKLSDEQKEQFIIIDAISEKSSESKKGLDSGIFGDYNNDLGGFVFSKDTIEDSSNVVYSGAYSLVDDPGFYVEDRNPLENGNTEVVVGYNPDDGDLYICPETSTNIDDCRKVDTSDPNICKTLDNGYKKCTIELSPGEKVVIVDPESGDITEEIETPAIKKSSDLAPYGFKLLGVENNKNGTATIKVSWSNRLVDTKGKEVNGYRVDEFELLCDTCSTKIIKVDGKTFTYSITGVPIGKANIGLRGSKVYYGETLLDGPTRTTTLNSDSSNNDGIVVVHDPDDGDLVVCDSEGNCEEVDLTDRDICKNRPDGNYECNIDLDEDEWVGVKDPETGVVTPIGENPPGSGDGTYEVIVVHDPDDGDLVVCDSDGNCEEININDPNICKKRPDGNYECTIDLNPDDWVGVKDPETGVVIPIGENPPGSGDGTYEEVVVHDPDDGDLVVCDSNDNCEEVDITDPDICTKRSDGNYECNIDLDPGDWIGVKDPDTGDVTPIGENPPDSDKDKSIIVIHDPKDGNLVICDSEGNCEEVDVTDPYICKKRPDGKYECDIILEPGDTVGIKDPETGIVTPIGEAPPTPNDEKEVIVIHDPKDGDLVICDSNGNCEEVDINDPDICKKRPDGKYECEIILEPGDTVGIKDPETGKVTPIGEAPPTPNDDKEVIIVHDPKDGDLVICDSDGNCEEVDINDPDICKKRPDGKYECEIILEPGDTVGIKDPETGEVTPISKDPGTPDNGEIDIIDIITNPDTGKDEVVPIPTLPDGSDPKLEEVRGGNIYDSRNELYTELDESTTFKDSNVKVDSRGIIISGISPGDRVVLKELKATGNIYTFDKNRTKLFTATGSTVVIPKDPYLQKDFQVNASSKFEYVIEVYKNLPCSNCSNKKAPSTIVGLYYEN